MSKAMNKTPPLIILAFLVGCVTTALFNVPRARADSANLTRL